MFDARGTTLGGGAAFDGGGAVLAGGGGSAFPPPLSMASLSLMDMEPPEAAGAVFEGPEAETTELTEARPRGGRAGAAGSFRGLLPAGGRRRSSSSSSSSSPIDIWGGRERDKEGEQLKPKSIVVGMASNIGSFSNKLPSLPPSPPPLPR